MSIEQKLGFAEFDQRSWPTSHANPGKVANTASAPFGRAVWQRNGRRLVLASAMLTGSLGLLGVTQAAANSCEDPDGDGWGWDGIDTCEPNQNSGDQPQPATSNDGGCVDTDGDGWGWVESSKQSCVMHNWTADTGDSNAKESNPDTDTNVNINVNLDGYSDSDSKREQTVQSENSAWQTIMGDNVSAVVPVALAAVGDDSDNNQLEVTENSHDIVARDTGGKWLPPTSYNAPVSIDTDPIVAGLANGALVEVPASSKDSYPDELIPIGDLDTQIDLGNNVIVDGTVHYYTESGTINVLQWDEDNNFGGAKSETRVGDNRLYSITTYDGQIVSYQEEDRQDIPPEAIDTTGSAQGIPNPNWRLPLVASNLDYPDRNPSPAEMLAHGRSVQSLETSEWLSFEAESETPGVSEVDLKRAVALAGIADFRADAVRSETAKYQALANAAQAAGDVEAAKANQQLADSAEKLAASLQIGADEWGIEYERTLNEFGQLSARQQWAAATSPEQAIPNPVAPAPEPQVTYQETIIGPRTPEHKSTQDERDEQHHEPNMDPDMPYTDSDGFGVG